MGELEEILKQLRKSDIVSRLREHSLPSSSERSHIESLTRDTKSVMDDISAQITFLEYQHQSLATQFQLHKAYLSSIQKLPREMLEEIFLLYRDSSSMVCLGGKDCPPLIVAAVCVYWRSIALSTQQLWNRIVLCLEDLKKESEPYRLKFMKRLVVFLDRSRDCSLDLELDGWDVDDEGEDELNASLLELLYSHASRIRSATLTLGPSLMDPTTDTNRVLNILWPASFPRLEVLSISLSSKLMETLVPTPDSRPIAFPSSPLLKSLTFEGSFVHCISFPVEQLRYLSIPSMELNKTIKLLKLTSKLDFLCLEFSNSVEGQQNDVQGSTLLKCISFHLILDNFNQDHSTPRQHEDLDNFLDTITVADINTLRLERYGCGLYPDQIIKLRVTLKPSLPLITSLTLRRFFNDTGEVVSFLSHLPSLESLELIGIFNDHLRVEGVLGALDVHNPKNGSTVLTPRLTSISLETTAFPEDIFISMVRSRWFPTPRSIASVDASSSDWVSLRSVSVLIDNDNATLTQKGLESLKQLRRTEFRLNLRKKSYFDGWVEDSTDTVILQY